MSTRLRILVLGGALPLEAGWERIDLKDVARIDPRPEAPVLLVVGDDAILRIDPAALMRSKVDMLTVLLAPSRADYGAFARWARAFKGSVTSPAGLADAVKACVRSGVGVRRHLEPHEWFPDPVEPGSAAHGALAVVPLLENAKDVNLWAGRLGWSRQLLWSVCRQDLAMTPREVLYAHALAQLEQARARGYTTAVVARDLGFKSASNLFHIAARRRDGWLPGRRSHRPERPRQGT